MPEAPDLGAASVIVDDSGRIPLVRHGYGELNWEVPGGGAEPLESAEATARREAREELGVELVLERLVGVYWEPGWHGRGAHHFVFRARLAPTSPRPLVPDTGEITESGWFSASDLPRPISDFTMRRIADALSSTAASVWTIGPRVWSR